MSGCEYILYNARILTQEDQLSYAEAIAFNADSITAVGDNESILRLKKKKTECIDLRQKTVLPGFIDAHTHFSWAGLLRTCIDLGAPGDVRTVDDLLCKLKTEAAARRSGEWVKGANFAHYFLDENRSPTMEELDTVCPDNPLIIYHMSGHGCLVNSIALARAGIDMNTPNPQGGIIEKIDGCLTGQLIENAQGLIFQVVSFSEQEVENALISADQYFIKHGITSVHEMLLGMGLEQASLGKLIELQENETLHTRIFKAFVGGGKFDCIGDHMVDTGIRTGFGTSKLKIGPYKLFIDGTTDFNTAAMIDPYPDAPDNYGQLLYTSEEIEERALKAYVRGWQVSMHTLGDRAVKTALDCIESVLKRAGTPVDRHSEKKVRFRLEHCSFVDPADIKRFRDLHVQPVINPIFNWSYTSAFDRQINVDDRRSRCEPIRSFLMEGICPAMGTDAPVFSANPFKNIEAGLTRKTIDDRLRKPEEAAYLNQLLKMYTIHGATLSWEGDIKGSLRAGKLADIIVLASDIEDCSAEEIGNMHVSMSFIGGRMVHCQNP